MRGEKRKMEGIEKGKSWSDSEISNVANWLIEKGYIIYMYVCVRV